MQLVQVFCPEPTVLGLIVMGERRTGIESIPSTAHSWDQYQEFLWLDAYARERRKPWYKVLAQLFPERVLGVNGKIERNVENKILNQFRSIKGPIIDIAAGYSAASTELREMLEKQNITITSIPLDILYSKSEFNREKLGAYRDTFEGIGADIFQRNPDEAGVYAHLPIKDNICGLVMSMYLLQYLMMVRTQTEREVFEKWVRFSALDAQGAESGLTHESVERKLALLKTELFIPHMEFLDLQYDFNRLEHLFSECHRVLATGGEVRIFPLSLIFLLKFTVRDEHPTIQSTLQLEESDYNIERIDEFLQIIKPFSSVSVYAEPSDIKSRPQEQQEMASFYKQLRLLKRENREVVEKFLKVFTIPKGSTLHHSHHSVFVGVK